MNAVHLHLIINHISLLTIPVALIFLIVGLIRKDLVVRRVALWIILLSSVLIIPTYLTGEKAADGLAAYNEAAGEPFNEQAVGDHGEAAETSRNITLVLAVLAALALYLQGHRTLADKSIYSVTVVTLAAVASLGYTSLFGGRIRHPESIGPFDNSSKPGAASSAPALSRPDADADSDHHDGQHDDDDHEH